MKTTLTPNQLQDHVQYLARKIPQFKMIYNKYGAPPLWDRPAGFATLLYIILEQQVSLASAKAVYNKLTLVLDEITPRTFLSLDDQQLKTAGFSRQKIRYSRLLALEILNGNLVLDNFKDMKNREVKNKLMSITGIGHWTSDIYLLMVLLRKDIWPHGDRALVIAAYEVFQLTDIPSYSLLKEMAVQWKPYRSVAARLLWHYYLNTKRK